MKVDIAPDFSRVVCTQCSRSDVVACVDMYSVRVHGGMMTLSPEPCVVSAIREKCEHTTFSPRAQAWLEQCISHENRTAAIKAGRNAPARGCIPALKPHQHAMVEYGAYAQKFINADDRGLGKTLEAIAVCMQEGMKTVLVTCPSYLKHSWVRELAKWAPEARAFLTHGTRKEREGTIENFASGASPKYLLVNYEMLRANEKTGGYLGKLLQLNFDAVIFDEAHRLKGRKSQWHTGAKALTKKAKIAQFLTGSPVDSNPADIWPLLHCIDTARFSSYWNFVNAFCVVKNGFYGYKILGLKKSAREEFKRVIFPFVFKREKSEIGIEMPAKVYKDILLDLEGKQKTFYRKLEKEAVLELENGTREIVPIAATKHLRLSQAVVCPALVGGPEESVVEKAALDILRDVLETEEKVILSTVFVGAAERYVSQVESARLAKVFHLTAKQKPEERDATVEAFKTCSEKAVLVGTMGTMGEGLNIDECNVMIQTDRAYTPGPNAQMEDRIHRLTSTKTKIYYRLVVRNTVSADKADVLKKRETDCTEAMALQDLTRAILERNGNKKEVA